MEKRALLAVVLSLLVFLIYSQFMAPQAPQPPEAPPTTEAPKPEVTQPADQAATPRPAPPAPPPAPTPPPDLRPAKLIEVNNGKVRLVFSEAGGRLVNCRLLGFKEEQKPDAPLKEMIRIEDPAQAPLELSLFKNSLPGLERAVYRAETKSEKLSAKKEAVELVFRWTSPAGLEVVKRYRILPQSYVFELDVDLNNRTGRSLDDNLNLTLTARHEPSEGGRYAFKGFGAYADGKLVEKEPKKLSEPEIISGKLSWGGYENSYFLQAILPLDQQGSFRGSLLDQTKDSELVAVRYTSPPFSLVEGATQAFKFGLFFGPKEIDLLHKAGHDLDRSINMGWFDLIAKPFLYFLKFTFGLAGNYGLAIILLTIGVKIVFWPLTQKSYKSMKSMQDLQPQMMKLREKFKNDKQRLNQEMMTLYRSRKVNPMGGCLPMVIQIPVFIALYRLLDYAIELRHSGFFLWITDLSAPDRLFRFPFSVPMMEPPYGIPVLTLLMGASMFIQQKMTPTPGDPTQAKIMLLMPIVFTFVFINFPSGLVLYWLVNNVLTIGQQMYTNRKR